MSDGTERILSRCIEVYFFWCTLGGKFKNTAIAYYIHKQCLSAFLQLHTTDFSHKSAMHVNTIIIVFVQCSAQYVHSNISNITEGQTKICMCLWWNAAFDPESALGTT